MKSERVILYIFHLKASIVKLLLHATHAEIESSAAAFLCVISGLLLPCFVSEVLHHVLISCIFIVEQERFYNNVNRLKLFLK